MLSCNMYINNANACIQISCWNLTKSLNIKDISKSFFTRYVSLKKYFPYKAYKDLIVQSKFQMNLKNYFSQKRSLGFNWNYNIIILYEFLSTL